MKKIISVVLVCILVCAFGCLSVSASGETISVESKVAKSGAEVELWVTSSEVIDAFGSIDFQISYNANDLTLTKAAAVTSATGYDEENEEEFQVSITKSKNKSVNPYVVQWRADYGSAYFDTTNLIKLTFQVNATEPGTYPVNVTYYRGLSGNYTDGNQVNYTFGDEDPLNFSYVNGGITIEGEPAPTVNTITVNALGGSAVFETENEISGKILVAAYDGNRMTNFEIYDAAAVVNVEGITADSVKVMWWDDLTSVVPLDSAKPITAAE